MTYRWRAGGAAWAVMLWAASAVPLSAQNVTAEDPARIAALLQGAGMGAELSTTVYGDPIIRVEGEAAPYDLRFYGCRNGKECLSVQFIAGFATTDIGFAEVNEWNRAMRYARAHVNGNGNVFIAHDLNLDAGGVSEQSFLSSVALWDQVMTRFMARIGW